FQELLIRETFRFFLEPCAEFLQRIIAKPGQLLMHSQKRRVHFPAIEVHQFLKTRIAKQDANPRGGVIRNHPGLGVAQPTRNQLRQRVMPMAEPLHQRLRLRALFLFEESKVFNPQFPNNRRGKWPSRATSSPNGGEFQVHGAMSPYPTCTIYTQTPQPALCAGVGMEERHTSKLPQNLRGRDSHSCPHPPAKMPSANGADSAVRFYWRSRGSNDWAAWAIRRRREPDDWKAPRLEPDD